MSRAQRFVRQSVVRHAQQHARRGRDAGQGSGKHTDQRANVNQHTKHRHAAYSRQHVHLIWSGAQILTHDVEAQHFSVGAHREECSRQESAQNHRARNRFQRIACLGTQGGGAFKAHKAEERQHQAEAQSAAGRTAQAQLVPVPVRSLAKQQQNNQITITETDAASTHNISRAEIFTSR